MINTGDDERSLIRAEVTRLGQEGKRLVKAAQQAGESRADLYVDAGYALAVQAERYREQLERARKLRPPRSGRTR
jgi:hypothetical protein